MASKSPLIELFFSTAYSGEQHRKQYSSLYKSIGAGDSLPMGYYCEQIFHVMAALLIDLDERWSLTYTPSHI